VTTASAVEAEDHLAGVPRPQPLGALPWPAGMLVVPSVEGADAVCAALVAGEPVAQWPEQLAFLDAALSGADPQTAAALVPGDDVVARYNRAVLVGAEPPAWQAIADASAGPLRALVDTARFSLGVVDEPPAPTGGDDEIAAVVLSARASALLEQGDAEGAVAELRLAVAAARAAGSPVLLAMLGTARSDLLRERVGDAVAAAAQADEVLRGMPMTFVPEVRAEALVARALARQETAGDSRGPLMAVVADLQEALRFYTEQDHPEMWATCNEHLALAYLVMPMGDAGDRLRLGIAVTSLRSALRVLRPETHPAAWASCQINLANALQYLPSAYQKDHLDEAVQLYEEVLQHPSASRDPVGVARILVNQGNALAHLGVLDDAEERVSAARATFEAYGVAEGVEAADQILGEIAEARARA
jgi:tetratricopeptide (TPR) repeat protein